MDLAIPDSLVVVVVVVVAGALQREGNVVLDTARQCLGETETPDWTDGYVRLQHIFMAS